MIERLELSTTQVAQIVQSQFPAVHPTLVTYLGEGYDSVAFDVNTEWVFRFPKRGDVEEQLLLEMRILPILAKRSPLPLPMFCFHGEPSKAFQRHFGGYPKLPGVPAIMLSPASVPFDSWAPVLGRFLSWLHACPVDEVARCGVRSRNVTSLIDEVRADALRDFENLNKVASHQPLEVWHAYLMSGPGAGAQGTLIPVLVHGDLAAEHIMCDPPTQTITGIIDWSEVSLADRSIDLAGVFHWGGARLVDAVLSTYLGSVDEATLRRSQFLAVCRGVGDVTFGLESGRCEYIDAGVRALTLNIGQVS